jgi:hypothetical protein
MAGTKRRRPRPSGGRFNDKTIGKRINDLRIERGLEAKQFYDLMKWEKGEHSRKVRGLTPIWPGEASKAAEILRAPRGWPYITTEEGALVEALGSSVTDVLRRLPEILAMLSTPRR